MARSSLATSNSTHHIPPVVIPRYQWSRLEELTRLMGQALHLHRKTGLALEVAEGVEALLSREVSAITWHTADDLEDWEKDDASPAAQVVPLQTH